MVITIIGPHAVGKTTAFENCLLPWIKEDYKRLSIVNCDNTRELFWAPNDNGELYVYTYKNKFWQASVNEKLEEFMVCAEDPDSVFICETAWNDHIRFAGEAHKKFPESALPILVLPTWETQKQFMQERCQRNNKEFRADYWTDKKLQYEAQNRFLNAAKRYLDPVGCPYEIFEMDNKREAWSKIIEFVKWEAGRMLL